MIRTQGFNESIVEQAALAWLAELNYTILYGPDIAPGEPAAARADYRDVILLSHLRAALTRINRHLPADAIDEAVRKVQRIGIGSLLANNHTFHRLLTEGIDISYRTTGPLPPGKGREALSPPLLTDTLPGQERGSGGEVAYAKAWLIDFTNPANNSFLAINQFTVKDTNGITRAPTERRPDIVLFVNGLPLGIIELKNAIDEDATIENAFNQLQTYQQDLPTLLTYNALLIIGDGTEARLGALGAGWEWFKTWRNAEADAIRPPSPPLLTDTLSGQERGPGGEVALGGEVQLETLLKGVCAPAHLLDLIRHFTVFEIDGPHITKKLAAYHQVYAVNLAVERTIQAAAPTGDHRAGVVWHTQGSGKSLTMLFYAGKIIQHPILANPTIIVLTDRNDLDDQLFGVFALGKELLRQDPVQARDRDHLKELLQVASGGVIFTTIQKFRPEGADNVYPLLSERSNIIFIADEAHRSQYGFSAHMVKNKEETAAYLAYGFAKYVRDALPNATFIGYTGTPIETVDINTSQVFGPYIDTYDIARAVADKATVPIYYTARLVPLQLKAAMRDQLDPEFEEITEGREQEESEKLKSKWSQLEAVVGTQPRLAQIAQDIVNHFEARLQALDGKAMIVCMSRRICVDLYAELVALRPSWHADTDDQGALKVIMTGSAADPANYQPHLRTKARRLALAERFKDPADPLKLVIVRDMWLTGFDAPTLHTMYIDKPMQGHTLMQAIARVNRVFKDKPSGLIVDYIGIAPELKAALTTYTLSASSGTPATPDQDPASPLEQAIGLMRDEYNIVRAFFQGAARFDYTKFHTGTPTERLTLIPRAMEHILRQADGKKRFIAAVTRLSSAFAIVMPNEQAVAIRDDVAFFQAIRAAFVKFTPSTGKSRGDMDGAIKQLIASSVSSTELIDILDAAGLKTPDISILSDDFLAGLQQLPQQNLALELLQKLLNDEIRTRSHTNTVQARSFAALMDAALNRYQSRAITSTQVIAELIELAHHLRNANQRGEQLGLTAEELAFYDALAENQSAVKVLGDQKLAFIAHELLKAVRHNATIDWTIKDSVRAKMRTIIKRILRQYGYPPDLEARATATVIQQAELLATHWNV